MALLLPPDLDLRDEEQLAAEAIGRVSGGLTTERIDSQIVYLRRLRDLVESGVLAQAVCPELTNANASSPHTVLLETQGWMLAQMARRINQLPVREEIEFHRLFGIELREAIKAVTTLRFTSDGQHQATIPEGTQVSTVDGTFVFNTTAGLVIAADALTGTVAAECTVVGARLLAPDTLTNMRDVIAFVNAVTNPNPVDSGSEAETVDQALARARNYQRRAERLVSARDVEDFILEEVMLGVGIVRAFPFIKEGDFDVRHAGHTTIVLMTPSGSAVSAETKTAVAEGLAQLIGSQFFYLLDPGFVEFSVAANIKIESIAPQSAIVAAVERNLRSFYAPRTGNFGRPILRSEIIAVIEGTPGVERIVSDSDGPIVSSPGADRVLAPYHLPKLNLVNITVVQADGSGPEIPDDEL
jgi:uncharacterized phage protein gp47/JayE